MGLKSKLPEAQRWTSNTANKQLEKVFLQGSAAWFDQI